MVKENRLRRFLFVCNNYTLEHIGILLKNIPYSYIIYGKEVAPKTGTPHLQGYCEMTQQMFLMDIIYALPGFHIEVCKGNQRQNIDYCKKGGDFSEYGTPRIQGQRTDLQVVADLCKESVGVRDIMSKADISVAAFNLIPSLLAVYGKQRDFPTNVKWYWGPTGTGKTRTAYEELQGPNLYVKTSGTGKWFDGYDGHENILMDDLRPGDFNFNFLLNLFDRYPMLVEVKCGTRHILAKNIIVTCPMSPPQFCAACSSADGEKYNQFFRRITETKEFKLK